MAEGSQILVSTNWLADNLHECQVVVLDASRHLPGAGRDPRSEFDAGHIPGARFLDLASLTDASSLVPAALPRGKQVATRLAKLGVETSAQIILYDDSALKTSARAWFALSQCGIDNVAVLEGGLDKWRSEGRPLESESEAIKPSDRSVFCEPTSVTSKAEMLANLESGAFQVLDARGADRVYGGGIDPVHGGQNGRIPSALNLPFGQVFKEDGTFKSPSELRRQFEKAGVQWHRPLVTTCGSGVTASVLLFAARLAGKADVSLYDGSWQEWEADPLTPKEQGPL